MPLREKLSSNQLVALLSEVDPRFLAETLVAFANADGGTVYLGVTEGGQPIGGMYPDDVSAIVHQAEMLCQPLVPVEWSLIEWQGAFVFMGQIRRSLSVHTLHDGRVLVRTGAENRPLRGDQLIQLTSTRSVGDYEAEAVPDASLADLDETVLEEYFEGWKKRQSGAKQRSLEELLIEMGFLTVDRLPTIAGLLLFGSNPQSHIPHSGLTLVFYEGTDLYRNDGPAGYRKREEKLGPLPRIIKETWEDLKAYANLGAVVTGLQRQEKWLYPPTAMREALVNAVAHRDYRLHGRGIEVKAFSDRLEISSPGCLPGFITVDNIIDEHFSRNPRIVSGLFQWGYIEELGQGVDVMIAEMINAGHPPPEFHDTPHSFKVVFRNIVERTPQAGPRLNMNERQAKALTFVQRHGRITSRDYQELCSDVTAETLRLDLVDLVERGVLLKVGAKRGTYYILR